MKAPTQIDALLSVEDVARILGIPAKTLLMWRSRGDGPQSFRVGRYVRYRPEDIARWISSRDRRGDA